jgi:rod shape determining protein RodA
MSKTNRNQLFELKSYDPLTIILCLLLMLTGWGMIFASEYNPDTFSSIFNFEKSYGKQLLWISLGIGTIVVLQFIEGRIFQNFAFILLGITLFLLIAVLFTKPVNGATSWFDFGGFRFQPSEFGKTATALALASLLSLPDIRMQDLSGKAQALLVLGVPTLLVLIQNDTGSTLAYLSFFLVLYRAGFTATFFLGAIFVLFLSIASLVFEQVWGILHLMLFTGNFILLRFWKKDYRISLAFIIFCLIIWYLFADKISILLLVQFSFALIFIVLNLVKRNWQITVITFSVILLAFIYSLSVNYLVNNILKEHQQERIWVWLRPEKCDPLGSLYNLEQSKYAIGSGGYFGKGFLEGERTKLDYVPEQSTDFIFCTVGEEWGFFGSFIVIALFITLLLRILFLAERQRFSFAKFYAYGVASILLFHIFVNVGMTMGVLPVIGIPLPFISYGGSSMISFSIMIGILLKLDSERSSAYR